MKNKCGDFPKWWGLQLHCLQYPPTSQCTQSRITKSHYSRIPLCEWLKNSCFCLLVTIAARPGSVGHQKATGQPWQSESAVPRYDKNLSASSLVTPTNRPHMITEQVCFRTVNLWRMISPILVLALKHTIAQLECYQQLFTYHLAYKTEHCATSI